MLQLSRSKETFDLASRVIPGGVTSSTRGLMPPRVFVRAEGSKIYDADGNKYIDYHVAFGPIILGHCSPVVDNAVWQAIKTIDLIGAGTTELEARLAAKIVEHVPSAEQVLFCNSGSEATYHAVRLTRAVTGRKYLVKFQGCYHGWHDYLATNVISRSEMIGRYDPLSAGTLPEALQHTLVLPFNNVEAVEALFRRRGEEIAGVILEPIPHNVGAVLPDMEFLTALRRLTREHGSVLIFDEVITGFRHDLGGYQRLVGVIPDLTTLGKAMANGYPISAICGRKDLMRRFNTGDGDVLFAGTFNGHPLSVAASLATIRALEDGEIYQRLFEKGEQIRREINRIISRMGIEAHAAGFGSVFVVYFCRPPIKTYDDLLRNNSAMDIAYRWKLIEEGVFSVPIPLKRYNLCAAHTDEDIARTLEAVERSLLEVTRSNVGA